MNNNSRVKVLHSENTIEMNKFFAKMTENPLSDEYVLLQKIRLDYPDYKVRTRQIKKNTQKETYAGLTYAYMRNYILTHTSEETQAQEIDEFDELILISRCQTKAKRYPTIKKWFLAKYPAIAQFGMEPVVKVEETANIQNMTVLKSTDKVSMCEGA